MSKKQSFINRAVSKLIRKIVDKPCKAPKMPLDQSELNTLGELSGKPKRAFIAYLKAKYNVPE